MKHETANLAHYLNLVTNDISCDHDLLAASSVMSRTMTPRKTSFDNMAIDR